MDSIKADHGYNMDSKTVRNLLQHMSELPAQGRRAFLQFVTGSPKLPIGGKSLHCFNQWYIAHMPRIQKPHPHVHGGLQRSRSTTNS